MGQIEKLKGEINKRGLANPNRFQAFFNVPTYVAAEVRDLNQSRSLNILCESLSFPGKQIESVDYSMYRNPLKIPSGYINDEVTVTFLLTEDFFVKKVFERWQGGIVDQRTYKARYLEEYVTDIVFDHQDKQDNIKYSITLRDCYPITVGAIEKSSETTDSAVRMSVTFACRDILADTSLY